DGIRALYVTGVQTCARRILSGGGTTVVAPTGTLAMSGTLEMAGRTLSNDGTLNWTGGTLDPNNANFINNTGTWTLQNNPAVTHKIGRAACRERVKAGTGAP